MGKTFHFLAGLHRSGNTLLSAILNQNPDIYSSPLGPTCEYMWQVHNYKHQNVALNKNTFRKDQLLSSMLDSYYSDVKKPIIIDRDKNWGHPANLEMIKKYITDKPKIIFTVRPIAEVLASLIAIDSRSLLLAMQYSGWYYDVSIPQNDNICNFLMHDVGEIKRILNVVDSINNKDNDGVFHIVRYADLIDSPEKTMDGIYKFLGMESFKHNFKNIQKIDEENDASAGLPKDLHKIRRTISKSTTKVDEYVSKEIQEKYSYVDDMFKYPTSHE